MERNRAEKSVGALLRAAWESRRLAEDSRPGPEALTSYWEKRASHPRREKPAASRVLQSQECASLPVALNSPGRDSLPAAAARANAGQRNFGRNPGSSPVRAGRAEVSGLDRKAHRHRAFRPAGRHPKAPWRSPRDPAQETTSGRRCSPHHRPQASRSPEPHHQDRTSPAPWRFGRKQSLAAMIWRRWRRPLRARGVPVRFRPSALRPRAPVQQILSVVLLPHEASPDRAISCRSKAAPRYHRSPFRAMRSRADLPARPDCGPPERQLESRRRHLWLPDAARERGSAEKSVAEEPRLRRSGLPEPGRARQSRRARSAAGLRRRHFSERVVQPARPVGQRTPLPGGRRNCTTRGRTPACFEARAARLSHVPHARVTTANPMPQVRRRRSLRKQEPREARE